MSSSLHAWQNVPDGSKLELRLESDGDFVGGARLVTDTGAEEQWSHTDLNPGPKRKTLKSPRDYVVRVRVAFVKPDVVSVTIIARIVKPDGNTHGTTYRHTVSGKREKVRRATIIVKTKK